MLFGILVLQNNFINREALLAAFAAWVVDKRRPQGEILRELPLLTQLQDELLRALTEQPIKQHGNDPEHRLAAISVVGSIGDELRKLNDPQLKARLDAVTQSPTNSAQPVSAKIPAARQRRGKSKPQGFRSPRVSGWQSLSFLASGGRDGTFPASLPS